MSINDRALLGLLPWNEGLHHDDWKLAPPAWWKDIHGRFAAVLAMQEATRAFARGARP